MERNRRKEKDKINESAGRKERWKGKPGIFKK